jgi:hypothetical protein
LKKTPEESNQVKLSNRATEFSNDLKDAFDEIARHTRRPRITQWVKNWALRGETVDVVGLEGDTPKVLVEAELLREDPASNVLKIWQWVAERKIPNRVIVIQAFSKAYQKRKKPRKKRAVFIGEKFVQEFKAARYEPMDFPYNPRPGSKVGGGARKKQAIKLAKRITTRLKRIAKNS